MTGLIALSLLSLLIPGSSELSAHGVEVARADHEGLEALQLRHRASPGLALVDGVTFRDGEISLGVAGVVDPDA